MPPGSHNYLGRGLHRLGQQENRVTYTIACACVLSATGWVAQFVSSTADDRASLPCECLFLALPGGFMTYGIKNCTQHALPKELALRAMARLSFPGGPASLSRGFVASSTRRQCLGLAHYDRGDDLRGPLSESPGSSRQHHSRKLSRNMRVASLLARPSIGAGCRAIAAVARGLRNAPGSSAFWVEDCRGVVHMQLCGLNISYRWDGETVIAAVLVLSGGDSPPTRPLSMRTVPSITKHALLPSPAVVSR